MRLLGSNVGEGKLRTVGSLYHDDVATAKTILLKGMTQTIAGRIQLTIRPTDVMVGLYHGQLIGIAPHIAHEAFYPCVMAFKDTLKL